MAEIWNAIVKDLPTIITVLIIIMAGWWRMAKRLTEVSKDVEHLQNTDREIKKNINYIEDTFVHTNTCKAKHH